MTLRQIGIGMALSVTAVTSSALTLGATTSVPLIGRPLSVSIPVLGVGEPDLCIDASVAYADSPVAPGLVRTEFQGTSPQQGVIRLRVDKAVDEPVVAVEVAAGCRQRVTRRYVLLADIGDEPVAPPTESSGSPAARLGTDAPSALASRSAIASASSRATGPNRAGNPVRSKASEPRASRSDAAAQAPGRGPERGGRITKTVQSGDRLRLDRADAAFERSPTLRLSQDLKVTAEAPPSERAAAAALWRVLNLDTAASLRGLEQISAMEAEIRGLRDARARADREVAALTAELARARSERYNNWLVLALAAVSLVLLLTAVWRRRPKGSAASPPLWASARNDAPVEPPPGYLPASQGSEPGPASEPASIDLDMLDSLFPDGHTEAATAATAPHREGPGPVDLADSALASPRGRLVEELLDLLQQVDFFISIGQHEQAIASLRDHLRHADSSLVSPVAYLELLRLHHQLGRRSEYEQCRADLGRVLGGQVPEFDDYRHTPAGLQAHPEVLSRMVVAWPRPAVLSLIEDLLFKSTDGEAFVEAIDLEACRDLLMLYTVAKDRLTEGVDTGSV